ncbi:hypothetical protein [Micromonospora maritima]|uniref:hypothetical protein n=1 Tax=Micromonospora maritima TaxID=986711 RepID=UPI00157DBD0A|nr:hypothetical protein [Micromonospora maritima]
MIEHACVLCAVYRRDAEPRQYERAQADDGCRRRLDGEIVDVRDLFLRLANPEAPDVDDRTYEAYDSQGEFIGLRRADPTSVFGGMAPTPARSAQPSVSGSRERQLPINPDIVDLLAPARSGGVRDTMVPATRVEHGTVIHRRIVAGPEGPQVAEEVYPATRRRPVLDDDGSAVMVAAGDQTGKQSVATVLDEIVRDWRDSLFPDERLPVPTVPLLTDWLLVRSTAACDRHPAIAEHAREIRHLRTELYRALGESEPLPQVMWGVLCRTEGCDDVSQLVRRPGSEYIECDACSRLYTEEEYREWTQLLAKQVRPKGRRRAGGLPEWATTTAAAAEADGPAR